MAVRGSARRGARRGGLARWLGRLLGWFAALLVLWVGLWLATGDSLAPVRLVLYVAPFVMLGAGAACLLGLMAGARAAALAHGAVALVLLAAQPPSLLRATAPPAAPPAEPAGRITVTSLSNRTRNGDMQATAEAMRQHPADIFALQEVQDGAALVGALAGLYRPGAAPNACRSGNFVIVSRYPVGAPHVTIGSVAMFCPVSAPGGKLWVGSVHLPRAVFDAAHQTEALAQVLDAVAGLAGPVILAGDFNATPLSSTVEATARRLVNVFDMTGSGTGFTFPTPGRRLGRLGAFLRIDHIFVSPGLDAVGARAARWYPPEADHYPVTAVLSDRRVAR